MKDMPLDDGEIDKLGDFTFQLYKWITKTGDSRLSVPALRKQFEEVTPLLLKGNLLLEEAMFGLQKKSRTLDVFEDTLHEVQMKKQRWIEGPSGASAMTPAVFESVLREFNARRKSLPDESGLELTETAVRRNVEINIENGVSARRQVDAEEKIPLLAQYNAVSQSVGLTVVRALLDGGCEEHAHDKEIAVAQINFAAAVAFESKGKPEERESFESYVKHRNAKVVNEQNISLIPSSEALKKLDSLLIDRGMSNRVRIETIDILREEARKRGAGIDKGQRSIN